VVSRRVFKAKLQWLQKQSQMNGFNLKEKGRETGRFSKTKIRVICGRKINELKKNSKRHEINLRRVANLI